MLKVMSGKEVGIDKWAVVDLEYGLFWNAGRKTDDISEASL